MGRGRRLLVLCLLIALLGAGCGGDDDKSSGSSGAASGEAGGSASGEASGGGDCLEADEDLSKAARDHVGPLKVATGGGEEGSVDRISVDVCKKSDEEATAVVIVYGMRDSIRDVRHEVGLIKVGPLWQVNNDLDTRRCQKGRGQQDFSGDICR